eukprot:162684-Chlamydomonas_euryale.AAC.5
MHPMPLSFPPNPPIEQPHLAHPTPPPSAATTAARRPGGERSPMRNDSRSGSAWRLWKLVRSSASEAQKGSRSRPGSVPCTGCRPAIGVRWLQASGWRATTAKARHPSDRDTVGACVYLTLCLPALLPVPPAALLRRAGEQLTSIAIL